MTDRSNRPSILFSTVINLLPTISSVRRVPLVRQLSLSDCAPAALAMVLQYHHRPISLQELKEAFGSSRDGHDASSIIRVAQRYGLRARGVQVDIDELHMLDRGSILYWQFNHFVVLDKVRSKSIDIVDPALGRRTIPLQIFRTSFTRVALTFEIAAPFKRATSSRRAPRLGSWLSQILEKRALLGRVLLTSLVLQLSGAIVPLMTGAVIDRVVPQQDSGLLWVLLIGYAVFQACSILASFVRSHLLIYLRTEIESDFTFRFLDHLIDLPFSFFQQHSSGDLMMRLGSNTVLKEILTSASLSTILDGAVAILYLVLLFITSIPLTAVVLVLAVSRFILLAIVRWRQKRFLEESLENQAQSQSAQIELLGSMETLKAMGIEQKVAANWGDIFVNGLNIAVRRGRLEALFDGLLNVLGTGNTFVFLFYATHLVLSGKMTLGTSVAYSALAAGFLNPLNTLVGTLLSLQTVDVYMERLNDVLESPSEYSSSISSKSVRVAGDINLSNVGFTYSRDTEMVLKDVCLDIPRGTRVAIVGQTGCGKSTLARLTAGLYDPTEGAVFFDGNDVRTLDRRSVRQHIGYVTQDVQLFGGSIRRNITLANSSATLDQIVRAARIAAVHDDIMAMPMGYETILSDRGQSLSGGQRQRLAIARAVLANPQILVLDEATSHLDAITEQLVIEGIAELACTQIVVAHRLSTVQSADLILVIKGGRIAERGSHSDLLREGGIYSNLVSAQRKID